MLHNERVNVKAFGAVGNGVADDTTPITDAISAVSGGGTVFFPPGQYKVTSAISMTTPDLKLHGAGATLARSGGSVLTFGVSNVRDIHIEGIKFLNSTNAVSFDGPNYATRVTFSRCQFESNATAVRVAAAGQLLGARFRDCLFLSNTGDVFNHIGGTYMNNVSFEDCWWQGPAHTTYFKDTDTTGQSSDIMFLRNTFEGPGHSGLVATHQVGSIYRLKFDSCHWADFTNQGLNKPLIKTGTAVNEFPTEMTVIGCTLWNEDGPIFYADAPTAFTRLAISGGMLRSKIGGTGPFGGNGALLGISLVSCDIPVAQTWNSGVEVTYVQCREAGVSVPFRMLGGSGNHYMELSEDGTTDAAAGAVNRGRLYVRDNGSGKTQLCVRFNTGAVQVIATEP